MTVGPGCASEYLSDSARAVPHSRQATADSANETPDSG